MNQPAALARRRLLVGLGVAAPAVLLAGCGLGNAQRRDFHLLRDADSQASAPPGPGIDKVLLVPIAFVLGQHVQYRARTLFQIQACRTPPQLMSNRGEVVKL